MALKECVKDLRDVGQVQSEKIIPDLTWPSRFAMSNLCIHSVVKGYHIEEKKLRRSCCWSESPRMTCWIGRREGDEGVVKEGWRGMEKG